MNYLLPLFTVIIWGGNTIVNIVSVSLIEPSAISFFRWFLAMLILTPFCLPSVIKARKVIRPYLAKLAVLGLLGMVLNQSLAYYASLTTSATNMSLIISLVPLLSIFIAVPLLGKRLSKLSISGAVISMLGLAYMLGQGDILFIFKQTVTQGDSFMLLAAFIYAIYCVLLKRWKMPLTNWQSVYIQGLFAVLMLCPLWLTSESLIPTSASLPLIAFAAIAASLIAPWMWVKAIDTIGAESSAMFMNLLPVITASLAVVFLGEKLALFHLIGGVMVISGVMLAQIKFPKNTKQIDANIGKIEHLSKI